MAFRFIHPVEGAFLSKTKDPLTIATSFENTIQLKAHNYLTKSRSKSSYSKYVSHTAPSTVNLMELDSTQAISDYRFTLKSSHFFF